MSEKKAIIRIRRELIQMILKEKENGLTIL